MRHKQLNLHFKVSNIHLFFGVAEKYVVGTYREVEVFSIKEKNEG